MQKLKRTSASIPGFVETTWPELVTVLQHAEISMRIPISLELRVETSIYMSLEKLLK